MSPENDKNPMSTTEFVRIICEAMGEANVSYPKFLII